MYYFRYLFTINFYFIFYQTVNKYLVKNAPLKFGKTNYFSFSIPWYKFIY